MRYSLTTILFDLDDTLVDSFSARLDALQLVFSDVGIHSPTAKEFLCNQDGSAINQGLSQLGTARGMAHGLFERFRRAYWIGERGIISLYPGIETVVQELYKRGVKLGVITQKRRAFELEGHKAGALEELRQLGIAGLFSVIVGFEDVTLHKPHPEPVYLAMDNLKSRPWETIFVGNRSADVGAATAAKCWSCLATWGIGETGDHHIGLEADLVARTPEELLGLGFSSSCI